jgi:hypothetical protein
MVVWERKDTRTMNVATATLRCVNHPDRRADRNCLKCRNAFCDPCLAFLVNGVPWCEPCANALADDVKPRRALAALVLGAGFGLTTLVWIGRLLLVPGPVPNFMTLLFLGYASSMYAGWSVLSNTTGEPPEIKRRSLGG